MKSHTCSFDDVSIVFSWCLLRFFLFFFLDIIAIELLGVMFVQELVDDDGVVVVDLCSKK